MFRPTGSPSRDQSDEEPAAGAAEAGGDKRLHPRQGDAVDQRLANPEEARNNRPFNLGSQQRIALRPPEQRQRRPPPARPRPSRDREQRVKATGVHQRKIDRDKPLMDAEHHRQQEQAGQHRRAKRVAVKMQEQP